MRLLYSLGDLYSSLSRDSVGRTRQSNFGTAVLFVNSSSVKALLQMERTDSNRWFCYGVLCTLDDLLTFPRCPVVPPGQAFGAELSTLLSTEPSCFESLITATHRGTTQKCRCQSLKEQD